MLIKMKNTFKTILLATFGLMAGAAAVQASSFGDLIVGFTTQSGNDQIYDIGSFASLTNNETWSASTLGIAGGTYDWGVIGSADIGELNGNATALEYTTIAAGTPPMVGGEPAWDNIDNSVASIVNELPGGINGFSANTGASVSASLADSWNEQTINGALATDYHIAYHNPNVVNQATASLYTVVANGSAPVLSGTFTLSTSGALTFHVGSPSPTAGFTGTPTTGYAPLPVVFTDASSGNITNWIWTFGDGHSVTNTTSSNVTHTYTAAGNYTVALTVSGPGGANTDAKSSYVVVSTAPAAPTAGFTGTPTSGNAPLPVAFTDASSGDITNWVWNFGDGHSVTTSTSGNVANTYVAAGNYTVTLIVSGPGGASTNAQSNYVTVFSVPTVPTAGFAGTPTSGYAPLPVVFTDASSGNITNWIWTFGDGNSVTNTTSSNVTNTYAVAGDYTVSLTVAGPGGANTNTQINYVSVSLLPSAPTAGFAGAPTSGYAPLPVVFTDASSGSITSWVWTFGDGHSVTNSTSSNVTNTYAAAGNYTVTLTVSGPGGANTDTQTSYVAVSINPAAPVAGFAGTPTSGYAPLPVVFSDASSGEITNWVWNFGNGHVITNTTSSNVTNIYAAAGNYAVTLTVSGPVGANTNTQSNYVIVSNAPAPVAGFAGTPTNGYAPLLVVFSDASSGDITNWVWNFGNGHSITNHTSSEVTNTYAAVGKYAVSLKVTGPGGASIDTKSSYVVVSNIPAPVAAFAGTPTNGFAPLPVVFSDASSGNITNWIWNFGNGHFITNSTGDSVTNTYLAVGKYTVSLKVSGPGGVNTDTKSSYVTVSGPAAGFTATPTNGFAPLQVVFSDTSGGNITNWVWNFGDGHLLTNSTGGSVTNTYATVGKYTVSLKVSGIGGANTNTKSSYVTVSGPVAGFTATPTNGFAPLQVVFSDTSGGNITNWVWNFGDGHSVTNSTGGTVTNTYVAVGKYTVSLKVNGVGGANTNTKSSYVTVSGPVAGFTATPTNGFAPLQVVFTNTSGGNITNWVWNFGDGHSVTNSTGGTVTNTYAAVGKYTVSLKVYGVGGANTNTKSSYVAVSGPLAGFTATPTKGFAPLQVVFSDASGGIITNWVWNFGNGHSVTNSTSGNVTNIYTVAGKYTVSLKVAGPAGVNTEAKSDYIVASPAPKLAHFSLSSGRLTFSGENGPAGQQYRILASTNLVDWFPVATNKFLNDGTYSCTNLVTTNHHGFFRLVYP